MRTDTIEIPRPTIDDNPPGIPDGATDWEAQEIKRCWLNACNAARLLALDAAGIVGALVDEDRDVSGLRSGADHQRFTELAYALGEYRARLEGVWHRLAVEARRATEGN